MSTLQKARAFYGEENRITKEEYEKARADLPQAEFDAKYSTYEVGLGATAEVRYRHRDISYTDDEIMIVSAYRQHLTQLKIEEHLRFIKGCVVFFVAVTVIGFLAGLYLWQAAFR